MLKRVNYVIYHRNNRMLGLTNHIDKDGDLDPNYSLARNLALTGVISNNTFVSKYPSKLADVKECASKGCPICKGIFKGSPLSEFYLKNVVEIDNKTDIPHPLTDYVIENFDGHIVD